MLPDITNFYYRVVYHIETRDGPEDLSAGGWAGVEQTDGAAQTDASDPPICCADPPRPLTSSMMLKKRKKGSCLLQKGIIRVVSLYKANQR